ncbi:Glutathione S-transferase, C-terminal-like [Parasponia andersonii]|uniref:Glutathione S-transferase n=1 Tax=Parasponia andersonii TaxID=3476 RepID=A0A2P5DEY4_PARAD|nr:Glutathione S-transferase, C-terminal-like [Parasponia andersonii]
MKNPCENEEMDEVREEEEMKNTRRNINKEKTVKSVQESLEFLEKHIKGKKFFGGDKIGYLDLVVGWVSHWLKAMEEVGETKLIEAERFPYLYKWCDNSVEFPLIKECIPPREAILEHFHGQLISYRNSLEPKKL